MAHQVFRRVRAALTACLAIVLATAGTSCAGPTEPVQPTVGRVVVSPESGPALYIGQTRVLVAEVRSTDGASMPGQTITWSTSDSAVVGVSAGVVTAKAPGTVTVTAMTGGVAGSATVAVIAVPVAAVVVAPDTATLVAGQTLQLAATTKDSAGGTLAGRPVTWISSDTLVAAVSAAGLVTTKRPGTTKILAVSEGRSATASLVVIPAVRAVVVTPNDATAVVGDTVRFVATVQDSTGVALPDRPVTWSSSAPSVASVDPVTGVVTALVAGTATITAAREGTSGTATVTVLPLPPIVRDARPIAAGTRHGCGLDASGTAYCWGADGAYRDGYPVPMAQAAPVAVPGAPRFVSLAAGGSIAAFDCAIGDAGAAYCWGNGTLGDGSTGVSLTPVPVAGGLKFVSVTAGANHACGITEFGKAYCWGANSDGRLGDGTTVTRTTPVPVAGGLRFVSLDAGWHHTCGVTDTGRAYCWGSNINGELGDGTSVGQSSPVRVGGGLAFVSISTGYDRTCALTSSGTAYCWGLTLGAPSSGSSQWTPAAVPGDVRFASIDVGYAHACGLTADGTAWCWGDNYDGALGNGTRTSSFAPVLVSGGTTFASISAGWNFSCAMTSDREAWCWGENLNGQLGDYYMSANNFSLVPVLLPPPLSSGTGGPIASVSIAPNPLRFYFWNASTQLIAWPRDADGRWLQLGCTMEWASTDPSIAEVDANGVVTARGPGTAYVTATCNDITGVVRVDVVIQV